MSSVSRGHRRSAAIVLALAFLGFVVFGAREAAIGVAWPSMRLSFDQPLAALGLLTIASVAGYMCLSILSGHLIARIGIGLQLTIAAGAAVIALAGFSLTGVWPVLLVASLLLGAAGGALDVGVNAYVAVHHGVRTMNLLHASFSLGTVIGPLLVTGALALHASWRGAYVVLLLVQLALLIGFSISWRHWRTPGAARPSASAAAAGPVPGSRSLLALTLGFFFLTAGTELSTGQWAYSVLVTGHGLDPALAGLVVAGYWGGLTAARLLGAVAGHRLSLTAILDLSVLVTIVASLVVAWYPGTFLAAIGLVLVGAGLGCMFPTLVLLTPRRVGEARTSAVVGYQLTAASLGASLMSAGSGVMLQRWGMGSFGPYLVGASAAMVLVHAASRGHDRAREAAIPGAVEVRATAHW